MPGWTDNLYGPSGLCVGTARGYVHAILGNGNKKANLVPADYCVNAMISAAWDVQRRYGYGACALVSRVTMKIAFFIFRFEARMETQLEIPVYNYIFDANNLTWGRYMRLAGDGIREPFDKTIWYAPYHYHIPSHDTHVFLWQVVFIRHHIVQAIV